MLFLLLFLPLPLTTRLLLWEGSSGKALPSQAPFHVTPYQGMLKLMWVHDATMEQGGGRATPWHAKPWGWG